jgi:RNA 2',3'-cyclic 3'-phosphodiesterase
MSAGARLFFALWPPAAARARLAASGAALALAAPAYAVREEKYHLTVAFVGEVAAEGEDRLRRIGRALRASGFPITCDAYEYWPKPEVLVAAARTVPPALQDLWDDLHRALAADDFKMRVKRLRPHVTLAKRVAADPALPVFEPFTWLASDLRLVRSENAADRSVYTVVDTWSLLDKPGDA